ncbi:MAG: hypothetical protein H0V66_00800 [Bdellovibrionales bacterium]|nr:hypothetical protein [Bdellovibrionales bacterium]
MAIKKWFVLFVFLILAQSVAQAGELITTVFNVIESNRTERLLVLSGSDGRIYRTHKSEANLKYFKSFLGQVVKITFAENSKELLISKIERPLASEVDPTVMDLNHFRYNQLREFAPTDLQSVEEVEDLFKGMLNDGDRRRSQCFKRAHMWAFDMWSKMGISSQKVFIFYTQRYIQLEDFEWWFHVAPMVVVKGEEYVLDGTFFTKPITVKAWKDHFIKSEKITCPVAANYDEYTKNQWTRLCFLMKVPMYFFSPLNIEERDLKNVPRNHWVLEELQDARRAFKGYEETYEGLDTGKPTTTF